MAAAAAAAAVATKMALLRRDVDDKMIERKATTAWLKRRLATTKYTWLETNSF